MPTQRELILDFLRTHSPQPFDDDQLASQLGIPYRQAVNRICSALAASRLIVRSKTNGKYHNSWRDTPSVPVEKTATMVTKRLKLETGVKPLLEQWFGCSFTERKIPADQPWAKKWDFVSPDGAVVGDAKDFNYAGNASAEKSVIAEYVWLLQHTPARRKFLIFGGRRATPQQWVNKYAGLAPDVEFLFFNENPERLENIGKDTVKRHESTRIPAEKAVREG